MLLKGKFKGTKKCLIARKNCQRKLFDRIDYRKYYLIIVNIK